MASISASRNISNKGINNTVQISISIIAILSTIIHLSIFGREIYTLANPYFDFGFIQTSGHTKIVGIISIFLYVGMTLGQKMFDKFNHFLILILGAIYSIGFASSPNGIEICVSIYFISHTACALLIAHDVKSGAKVIITNALAYILISYGMHDAQFIAVFLSGLLVHFFALPIFSNSNKTQGHNLRTLAIMQTISSIFTIFIIQTLININPNLISQVNTKISLALIGTFLFFYGTYYAIKKYCIVKSIFHASIFLLSSFFILNSLSENKEMSDLIFSSFVISTFYLYIMAMMIKAFFRHKEGRLVENIYKILFIISLLGFSGFPFISPNETLNILSEKSIYANIFIAIYKSIGIVIALKFALTFERQIPNGHVKSKIHLDSLHKSIAIIGTLYATFYSIANFNQSFANSIANLFSYSLSLLAIYIIASPFLKTQKSNKNTANEYIMKIFIILTTIYESIIAYIGYLFDTMTSLSKSNITIAQRALHEIQRDSNDTHHDKWDIQKRNETVVYIISAIGIAIMIKMFS